MILTTAQGLPFLIDDEDEEKVRKYNWNSSHGYIKTTVKNKTLVLARYLMNAPAGFVVDHVNHDTLDNRKENLRVCTHQQNLQNASMYKNNKTGYKGVHFNQRLQKFQAYIRVNKRLIHLGLFQTAEEAYEAYRVNARATFGSLANI